MTLHAFIDTNRAELDRCILRALDRTAAEYPLDDDEREAWIMNDEGLYRWAVEEGAIDDDD